MRRVLAALALLLAAGCGVRTEDEPEILRSPPPAPTATPSATEQPTPSETPTVSAPGTRTPTPVR